MNTRSTGRTSSASTASTSVEIGGVGVDHPAALIGDQRCRRWRSSTTALSSGLPSSRAGDAQDAGGQREQREHADHGEDGEQRQDVGLGIAAADQQEADRRADQQRAPPAAPCRCCRRAPAWLRSTARRGMSSVTSCVGHDVLAIRPLRCARRDAAALGASAAARRRKGFARPAISATRVPAATATVYRLPQRPVAAA